MIHQKTEKFIKELKKYPKELITLQVEEITPYENNNKDHTTESVDGVQESMRKSGYISPIIVDENNVIIAGHGRLLSLKRFGEQEIEVIRVSGMPENEKKYNRISDNTTNLLSGYNKKNLITELKELGDFALDIPQHLNFDLNFDMFDEKEFDEAKEDEVPSVTQPKVQYGDFFQLGEHFLLCGDSTNTEDVQKLTQGNKMDLIFTDPPYNIDYKGTGKNTSRGIRNDKMKDEKFQTFINCIFRRLSEVTKKTAGFYVFHSSTTQSIFEKAILSNGMFIKSQLIWNKNLQTFGWADYRQKHEPFFYGGFQKGKTKFYGDRTHTTIIDNMEGKSDRQILQMIKRAKEAETKGITTIWTIKKEKVGEYIHPTQKPVELIEYALRNSSKAGEKVVDLFGGSGSTLIACEKIQRQCFSMELDPTFAQTIIERFHHVTNGKKEIKCLSNPKFNFSFLKK